MSEQPAAGMLWLLEVASLRVEVTAAHLRARLGELRLPLRIVRAERRAAS